MKKVIALLVLFALTLSFVACGNSNNEKTICTNCDAGNVVDAKFCSACGASLVGTVDNPTNNNDNNDINNEPVPETATCIQCDAECEIGHSYCEEHECLKESCIMQRKSGSKLCVAHSCIYCGKERYGKLSWCYSHRCDSCDNAVVGNSDYCINHKCVLCDNAKSMGTDYCTKHRYQ